MIPFLKTDTSLGKSLLTLSPKDSRSIFNLDLPKKTVLVEDDMSNIFEAAKYFKEADKDFVYGLRLNFANSDIKEEIEESAHKNIVFAKNSEGVYELMELFSSYRNAGGNMTYDRLLKYFTKNMTLWVPFYDSYIHRNFFKNGNAIPRFGQITPTFAVERNLVAFDHILEGLVKKNGAKPTLVKSIYYKERDDFKAWQTFKIACGRFTGKSYDIGNPNLEFCNSREFSWESYNESKDNS